MNYVCGVKILASKAVWRETFHFNFEPSPLRWCRVKLPVMNPFSNQMAEVVQYLMKLYLTIPVSLNETETELRLKLGCSNPKENDRAATQMKTGAWEEGQENNRQSRKPRRERWDFITQRNKWDAGANIQIYEWEEVNFNTTGEIQTFKVKQETTQGTLGKQTNQENSKKKKIQKPNPRTHN